MTKFTQIRGQFNVAGAPTERATLITHRLHKYDGSKRAVILLPGHNGDATTVMAFAAFIEGNQVLGDVAAAIRACLPALAIDAGGGQTFGNDAAITRIGEAVDWIASSGFGKADKVILAGTSMGSIAAVNYATRNPAKVKALALFYPAMDLQYTHDNAQTAEVNAAYGSLAAFDAAKASHSGIPQAAAGSLGQIPIKGWHSTPDNTVGPNAWSDFKTALAAAGSPAPGDHDLGNVGHGDNTLVPWASVKTFYEVHA